MTIDRNSPTTHQLSGSQTQKPHAFKPGESRLCSDGSILKHMATSLKTFPTFVKIQMTILGNVTKNQLNMKRPTFGFEATSRSSQLIWMFDKKKYFLE